MSAAGFDPPADRTAGDVETLRDLGDCEEFDLIVAVTATTDMARQQPLRYRGRWGAGFERSCRPPITRRMISQPRRCDRDSNAERTACAARVSRMQRHRLPPASRRATRALMLATVILRERPSL